MLLFYLFLIRWKSSCPIPEACRRRSWTPCPTATVASGIFRISGPHCRSFWLSHCPGSKSSSLWREMPRRRSFPRCLRKALRCLRRFGLIDLSILWMLIKACFLNPKKTRSSFEGMVPLVENGRLSHMAWRTSFFIFLIGTLLFKLTFGRCKNSRRVIHFLPGFYRWKGTFWCRNPKRFD